MPRVIRPNPGPQTALLESDADVVIFGGSAGGGKTFASLLMPLRYSQVNGFGAVIFRRTYPEIEQEGGLWDEAMALYMPLGAVANENKKTISFPSGATVSFAHLQHEKDRYNYQGAQIPLIEFDELTHFTESQFWYMFSRNRSTCGVTPRIICTTNPDADSWVRPLVDWYIGPDGYALPDRSGVVRYFVRNGENLEWFPTKDQAEDYARGDDLGVKSFCFIMSSLTDNPILMAKDPGYLQNLKSLGTVDRERLWKGNWNIRYQVGNVFRKEFFKVVDAVPGGRRAVRYWDRASTQGGGDYTVGVKMSIGPKNDFIVEDVVRGQWSPAGVEKAIVNTAQQDGRSVAVWLEQEPGSSGVADVQYLIRALAGFMAYANKKTGSKLDMAKPFAAQAEAGNVAVKRAPWNDAFFREHESFDGSGAGHDDQVDAASGAFTKLAKKPGTYESV